MKHLAQLFLKLYRFWLMLPPSARSLGLLTLSRYLHGLLRLVMSPLQARLMVAALVLVGMAVVILQGHEIALAWDDAQAALEMLLGELLK
jgi:hypothetical protein